MFLQKEEGSLITTEHSVKLLPILNLNRIFTTSGNNIDYILANVKTTMLKTLDSFIIGGCRHSLLFKYIRQRPPRQILQ